MFDNVTCRAGDEKS